MYIDEVGTDDLLHLEQDNHRYLSLTGTIIRQDHVGAVLNPALLRLKQDVFLFDVDEQIHLHRSDIARRRGVFGQLRDDARRAMFDEGIRQIMSDTEYSVITAFVDKLAMTRQQHWQQRHPYHYLIEILVEKYVQFLERQDDIGDIMPEARRGKKDKALQAEFTRVKENGTRFVSVERVHSRIRAANLKFRTKKDNVSGLQLCDLLAHPSHIHIRDSMEHPVNVGPFAEGVIGILRDQKYDRSNRGRIEGYGIKTCP